jgi:zinc transport system substrate-binding protein
MPRKGLLLVAAAAAAAALLAGCGSAGESGRGGDGKLVVAAFYPLAYAAEQVAGGTATVRNLTPPGAEPHDLELTPGDVKDVDAAALVLYLGEGFMPGLERALQERSGPSLDLLPTGRGAASGALRGDPHVWLDPLRYASISREVGSALGREQAAERLAQRLRRLDGEYRRGLAGCARREIVTSHAAFGWLARRYGLEQVPLEGLAPEAEPSAKEIGRLVDVVRSSGATTVFSEPLLSAKLAETVAREAGVGTATLDPLEGLSEDAAAAGADYFSVMRENLATLRKALGCTG